MPSYSLGVLGLVYVRHISLMSLARGQNSKLLPGATRILFVKNLDYRFTGEELYDFFARYGGIHQVHLGNEAKTEGPPTCVLTFVIINIFPCHHSFNTLTCLQSAPHVPPVCVLVENFQSLVALSQVDIRVFCKNAAVEIVQQSQHVTTSSSGYRYVCVKCIEST
jgi:RNA recognition motif-containing protein